MKLAGNYEALYLPGFYWMIILGGRFFFNRMDEGFDPDFLEGIRKEGVFIICSLILSYFLYWVDNVNGGAVFRKSLFCIVFVHVLALVISLLALLWKGVFSPSFIGHAQVNASTLMILLFPAIICFHSEWFD